MIQKVLFVIVLFVTSILKTVTGFAGTALSMPFALRIIDALTARIVLGFFSWINAVFVTFREWKNIQWKILAKIVIFMLIGVIIGMKIYELAPLNVLLKVYGVFIILVALQSLVFNKTVTLSPVVSYIVLLLSGIIHGMFLSGSALLVIYAADVLKEKKEFRATMSAVWAVLNAYMIIKYLIDRVFTNEIFLLIVVCIVPFFLAIFIGEYMQKRFSQKVFMTITYIVLLVSGIVVMI